MIRFLTYAVPMLLLLFACFGFVVDVLELEPRSGAIVKLPVFEQGRVSGTVVLGIWLMEACGLLALFLMAQGRCGAWWLDGLISGWLAWVFRGPLLVLTLVVAARQPQGPWWDVAFGWWILYSICGLSLAFLARASGILFEEAPVEDMPVEETPDENAPDEEAPVESVQETEPANDEALQENGTNGTEDVEPQVEDEDEPGSDPQTEDSDLPDLPQEASKDGSEA